MSSDCIAFRNGPRLLRERSLIKPPIYDRAAGVMSSCMIAKESLLPVLRSQFVIEARPESNRWNWCCDSALVAPACCFFVLCTSRTIYHSELYSRTALFLVSMVFRKASSYMSVSGRTLSGIIFSHCFYISLIFSLIVIISTASVSSRPSLLSLLLEMASCSDFGVLSQVVTC